MTHEFTTSANPIVKQVMKKKIEFTIQSINTHTINMSMFYFLN